MTRQEQAHTLGPLSATLVVYPDGADKPGVEFFTFDGFVSRCISAIADQNIPDARRACDILNRYQRRNVGAMRPTKDSPNHTHHALVLDGMSLQMKLGKPGYESDTDIGSVVFAFDDDALEYEQSEAYASKTTRWVRIAASEILELRDFLNRRFPVAKASGEYHGT